MHVETLLAHLLNRKASYEFVHTHVSGKRRSVAVFDVQENFSEAAIRVQSCKDCCVSHRVNALIRPTNSIVVFVTQVIESPILDVEA